MLLNSNLFYVKSIKEKNRARFFKDIKEGDYLIVQHSSTGEYIVKNIKQKTERQVAISVIEQRFEQLELDEIDLSHSITMATYVLSYITLQISSRGKVDVCVKTPKEEYEISVMGEVEFDLNHLMVYMGGYKFHLAEIEGISVDGKEFNNKERKSYYVQKQQA